MDGVEEFCAVGKDHMAPSGMAPSNIVGLVQEICLRTCIALPSYLLLG